MERVTDEEAGEGGWYWNEQVGSFRPPGALYCRECGVLIQEYDHLYVFDSVFGSVFISSLKDGPNTACSYILCWYDSSNLSTRTRPSFFADVPGLGLGLADET
jgi:hypothetical protein